MIDELVRAAVEQGAYDGAIPRNKTDGKNRNKDRSDESAWQHIVYRAASYKGAVLRAKLVANRLQQSKISTADRKRVLDAYRLAVG